MTEQDVLLWAVKNTPCRRVKKNISWNGYDVYEECYSRMCYVGYPLVILVKGDEIRESTDDEALEYLDYTNSVSRLNGASR